MRMAAGEGLDLALLHSDDDVIEWKSAPSYQSGRDAGTFQMGFV
jgi:hypothetical protein